MNEHLTFVEFFNLRLKERGYTLKKLAEVSGIAIKHLENLSQGNFNGLPPAPYLRGYVTRLGEILEFDSVFWWDRLRGEAEVATSGHADSLPKNRFARASNKKAMMWGLLGLLIVIYAIIRLPHILGRPQLTIISPEADEVAVTEEEFVLEGRIENGDRVIIFNEDVPVAEDGSWSKGVLLTPGPNDFTIEGKKSLGRSSSVTKRVIYTPVVASGTTPPPGGQPSVQPPEPAPTSSPTFSNGF